MPERKPYVIEEREVTLVLDDTTPFPGAEIDVSLSLDWPTYMAVERWLNEAGALGEDDETDVDAVDHALRSAADLFAPYLIGWNLATRKGPIPPTADGLLCLPDPRLMAVIIRIWVEQIGQVAPPLGAGSNDGTTPSSTPTAEADTTSRPAKRSKSRRSSASPA